MNLLKIERSIISTFILFYRYERLCRIKHIKQIQNCLNFNRVRLSYQKQTKFNLICRRPCSYQLHELNMLRVFYTRCFFRRVHNNSDALQSYGNENSVFTLFHYWRFATIMIITSNGLKLDRAQLSNSFVFQCRLFIFTISRQPTAVGII